MKCYKICFVGLGSIAKRHILNLKYISQEKNTEIIIDVLRSGKNGKLPNECMGIVNNIYLSKDDMPQNYDIIFITNPTVYHYETLKSLEIYAKNFFIEKPAFHEKNMDIGNLHLNKDKIYYVACPLRYTKTIQYLKENIDFSQVYCIRAISSSFLPDWRPGIDYRNTYSSHKKMGGGVAIDLIHEWDYLTYLIGFPQRVLSFRETISKLEIDSDDISVYIAKYSDKIVELHLDYFGRKSIRQIELFMENDTIVCDLLKGSIQYMKSDKCLELQDERDDFQRRELVNFLNIIERKIKCENTLEHSCKVLSLAEGYIL